MLFTLRCQPPVQQAPRSEPEATEAHQAGRSLAAAKRQILELARKLAQKSVKDKALAEYQKLLKLDPKGAKLRLEVGDAHRRWGQVEEAVETYHRVAEQYMAEGFDA